MKSNDYILMPMDLLPSHIDLVDDSFFIYIFPKKQRREKIECTQYAQVGK